jgi:ribose transport system ATP-binding protein
VILALKEAGAAVLYISHRLPEVKAIADRVTVLRDGRLVATREARDLDPESMAASWWGATWPGSIRRSPPPTPSTRCWPSRARWCRASSTARASACAGARSWASAGSWGAGRTELFEGLMGLRPFRGQVTLEGRYVRFRSADEAFRAGVAYVTEDRKGKGLLLGQDLRSNLSLATLDGFRRGPFLSTGAEEEALTKAVQDFDIRARRRDMLAGQLSGGNQQKLLLAKMMRLDPRVVIVDEPTRGVDIGTKEQIYRFIAGLAQEDRAVVVISSELPELIGLCHRVVVMREGRIAGEVSGDDMTEDAIVFLATGVNEARVLQRGGGSRVRTQGDDHSRRAARAAPPA